MSEEITREKALADATQMARRTLCKLCGRLRPCGKEDCVAYPYSDQEGKDQDRLRRASEGFSS